MGKAKLLETPAEVETAKAAVPEVAIKAAGTLAVNWLSPATAVARALPFQSAVAPEAKPLPLTIRAKAGPPATAEAGARLEIARPGGVTVKLMALETAPAGLATVMAAVPGVAVIWAGTIAVNCVGPLKVVESGACISGGAPLDGGAGEKAIAADGQGEIRAAGHARVGAQGPDHGGVSNLESQRAGGDAAREIAIGDEEHGLTGRLQCGGGNDGAQTGGAEISGGEGLEYARAVHDQDVSRDKTGLRWR